jgi:hypothetical protein
MWGGYLKKIRFKELFHERTDKALAIFEEVI